jgi:hypothetical protein
MFVVDLRKTFGAFSTVPLSSACRDAEFHMLHVAQQPP